MGMPAHRNKGNAARHRAVTWRYLHGVLAGGLSVAAESALSVAEEGAPATKCETFGASPPVWKRFTFS